MAFIYCTRSGACACLFKENEEVEARAAAQALGKEEAEAKTRRRERRGVAAVTRSEAAAESVTEVGPVARSVLGDTEHARAPCT